MYEMLKNVLPEWDCVLRMYCFKESQKMFFAVKPVTNYKYTS